MRRKKQYASRNEGYARDSYDDELANGFTEEEFFATISKDESALTYAPFQNEAFKKIEEGSAEMAQGDHGAYVVLTRNVLNNLDHTIDTDSQLFDEALTKEVASYQEKKGLKVTQTINAETVRALDKEAAAKQSGDDELTIAKRAKMLYLAFEHKSFLFFGGTDEATVYAALQNITNDERDELIEYYDAHYKPLREKSLVADLISELNDKELFIALQMLYQFTQDEAAKVNDSFYEEFPGLLPVVYIKGQHPWIKSKKPHTIVGANIEYDMEITYDPSQYVSGTVLDTPVVREVLVRSKVDHGIIKEIPAQRITRHPHLDDLSVKRNKGGRYITNFTMDTTDSGVYEFVFVIENVDGSFTAYTEEHEVRYAHDVAKENADDTELLSFNRYRTHLALTDFKLSKRVDKEQFQSEEFYIEPASFTVNPEVMSGPGMGHTPSMYYSIKGPLVSAASEYLWIAEPASGTEKMPSSGKTIDDYGYAKGNHNGINGWKMKSEGTKATFFRIYTGDFNIRCYELDEDGNRTSLAASYRQVVLPQEEHTKLSVFREYAKGVDKAYDEVNEETVIPIHAALTNIETSKSKPVHLYVGKSKKYPNYYVLLDLTLGISQQRVFMAETVEALFDEFEDDNTHFEGVLAYRVPPNDMEYPELSGQIETDGTSDAEEKASNAVWMSLGAAGLAALTAEVYPNLSLSLMGTAVTTGLTASYFTIIDKLEKGTLTNETILFESLMVASNLLGFGGIALRSRMSRQISSTLTLRSGTVLNLEKAGLYYINLSNLTISGVGGMLITVNGLRELDAIAENESLTTGERIERTAKILAHLLIVKGLLLISSKNLGKDEMKMAQHMEPYNGAGTNKSAGQASGANASAMARNELNVSERSSQKQLPAHQTEPGDPVQLPSKLKPSSGGTVVGIAELDRVKGVAAIRGRYLVRHYSDNGQVVDFVKNLAVRAMNDEKMKTALNRLLNKLVQLHHFGKSEEALAIMNDLKAIEVNGKIAKAYDGFLWGYTSPSNSLALSPEEMLGGIRTLHDWNTTGNGIGKMPIDYIQNIGDKIQKGQINGDSYKFILRHWGELDKSSIEALEKKIRGRGLNNYISRINSLMTSNSDVNKAIKDATKSISRFEKAEKILLDKGYTKGAEIADEGKRYFTIVNNQIKDFIRESSDSDFETYINKYRLDGNPNNDFTSHNKNFGDGMIGLRNSNEISEEAFKLMMKEMRRHHQIMSTILKDNPTFQKIIEWGLRQETPLNIGFNDFGKNIILIADAQHGFHKVATSEMTKNINKLEDIFDETERRINKLDDLIKDGTEENFKRAYFELTKILEREEKSIFKYVIQKENGHLDTKHLNR